MVDRVIRIVLDPTGVKSGGKVAERSLRSIDRSGKKATQTLGGLASAARVAIGFLGVRAIIRYADTWLLAGNRIRLATDSVDEFNTVQRELVRLSNDTRNSLTSTVELYARAERSTRALGLSQKEVIDLTRTVNQTLQISGATAAEAAGSTIQFAQGLGAGALRGQELLSVLEGNQRLSIALADSFEVGVGQLKALGEAGKLTTVKIFAALKASQDEIQGEFEELAVSVGSAFTVLGNSAGEFFGRLGEGSGATSLLSRSILDLAAFIRGPLLEGVNTFIDSWSIATDVVGENLSTIQDAVDVFGINSEEVFGFIADAMLKLPINIVFAIRIATVEITSFFEILETKATFAADKIASKFNTFEADIAGTVGQALGADEVVERAIRIRLAQQTRLAKAEAELRRELGAELKAIEAERLVILADLGKAEELLAEKIAARKAADAERVDLSERGEVKFRGVDEKLIAKQKEFLDALEQTQVELAIETALLDEAEGVILRYRTAIEAAALGDALFVEQALAAADAINQQAEALEAAQNRASDLEFIESLEVELRLLGLSNRERAIEIELRELSAEATEEQIKQARELAGAIFDEADAQRTLGEQLEAIADQTARNIQDIWADFFFDPFEDGLEGMVRSFADALRRMVANALAASLLEAIGGQAGLGDLLGGAIQAGAGSGSASGGNAAGGGVRPGVPTIVGENGPEFLFPITSGSIFNQGQFAQMAGAPPQVNLTSINTIDESEIVGAFQGGAGDHVFLNRVSVKRNAFRRALGIQ